MRYFEIVLEAVGTPSFKAWFRSSKVVDGKGAPLLVYHGTRGDFDTFETIEGSDLGAHFGTLDQAHQFVRPDGSSIMPCYLCIQHPLRLPDLGRWDYSLMSDALRKHGIEVGDVPRKNITADYFANEIAHEHRRREAIIRAIEGQGYDGIVYRNATEGDGDSWIVFHSQQVKSATGNRGSYSPTDGSIMESMRSR